MSEKGQIERLLNLLERKDFEALSAAEKSYVLQRMTEDEYEEERSVIVSSKTIIPLSIPIEVDRKLKSAFGLQAATQTNWWQYKIPVWQVVFLVGVVSVASGILGWLMNTEKEVVVPKTETIYVHTTDTIYKEIEKEIFVERSTAFQQKQTRKELISKEREKEALPLKRIETAKELKEKTLSPKDIPTKESENELRFAYDIPLNVNDLLIDEAVAIERKKGKSVADDTTLINYQMKVY